MDKATIWEDCEIGVEGGGGVRIRSKIVIGIVVVKCREFNDVGGGLGETAAVRTNNDYQVDGCGGGGITCRTRGAN